MHPLRRQPLSRRLVLRGLGASLALPLLDAMLPSGRAWASGSKLRPRQKAPLDVPRVCFCYVPNGVNIKQWVPANAGASYQLSATLAGLQDLRDRLTVLSGLGHPTSRGGHTGADTWLTAADLKAVPGRDYANTISLDQVLAKHHGEHTRFPSLELSDSPGTGSAGHSHTLAFSRTGTPLPAEASPMRAFNRLFVPDNSRDRQAALRRYSEERSILDSVAGEAKALRAKLGASDQGKLDEYMGAVRETEARLARLQAWIDRPRPQVAPAGLHLDAENQNGHDRELFLDVMLDLTYLAFATDTTRVVTFEWSREAGGVGPDGSNHHELSHHGGDPRMLRKLAEIDRFHVERLGRFLRLLAATGEKGASMLDRTVVVFGSGMNSGGGGEHSPKNLPLLVAGGRGLGLRHGKHLAFDPDDHPPLTNLWLTLLQAAGVPAERFADSTGPMAELTA